MESKRVFFVAHLCFADLAMSLPPEIPYTLCCYAYNCLELPGQLGKDLVRKASRQNSCWFKAVLQPLNGWIVQFEELSSTLLDENPSFNCRSAHSNGQLHVVFALPCSFLRCQGWCWTILVMLQQSSATGKHWWIPCQHWSLLEFLEFVVLYGVAVCVVIARTLDVVAWWRYGRHRGGSCRQPPMLAPEMR